MFSNFLSSSKRPSPPKKASSSMQLPTSSDDDARRTFQRAASQPSYVMNQSNESSYSYSSSGRSPDRHSSMMTMSSSGSLQEMERSSVFGSCAQVLSTVITALAHTVQAHKFYAEPAVEGTTTRAAKLLYVSLLERVQKERGEWQGFAQSESDPSSLDVQQETALVMLETHVASLPTVQEKLAVLHELLEVSFRNLRGALVSTSVYMRHRKRLADDRNISLAPPPSLPMLLMVGELLSDVGRDEKLCLFRLLVLWNAIVAVNGRYSLIRIIDEQHAKIFSESTDFDYMTARKGARHDIVAMDILQLLAQYRDVLFSDLEYIVILQELHASPVLTEDEAPASHDKKEGESDVHAASDYDADASLAATSLPSLTPLSPAVCMTEGPQAGSVLKKVLGATRPTVTPEPTTSSFEETETSRHSSLPETSEQAQAETETVGLVPSTPAPKSGVIMAVKPSQNTEVGSQPSDVPLNLMDASHLELEHNQSDLSGSETDSAGSIVESFVSTEAQPLTEAVSPLVYEGSDGEHANEWPASVRDKAPVTESSPRKSAVHGPVVSIRHHSLSPLKSIRHTKTLPNAHASNQDANTHDESSSPDEKEHSTRKPTILWQDAIKVADLVEKSHKTSHSGHSHHHSSHSHDSQAADTESPPSKLERQRSLPNSPRKKAVTVKPRDASDVTTVSTHYFSLSLAAATLCTMATMAVYALRKPH